MNVSVFGLGYVGCVSATCLARAGHRVVGVDVVAEKVDDDQLGHCADRRAGARRFARAVVADGRLSATTSAEEALRDSDLALDLRRHAGRRPRTSESRRPHARWRRHRALPARARTCADHRAAQHGTAGTTEQVLGDVWAGRSGKRSRGSLSRSIRSSCARARRCRTSSIRRSCSSDATRPQTADVLRVAVRRRRCAVRPDDHPNGGDGEVRLQCVPRAEGLLHQRDRRSLRRARGRCAGGDADLPDGSEAERLGGVPQARLRLRRLLSAQGCPRADECGAHPRHARCRSCRRSCRPTKSRCFAASRRSCEPDGAASASSVWHSSRAPTTCARARWSRWWSGSSAKATTCAFSIRPCRWRGLMGANRRYIDTEIPHIASLLCEASRNWFRTPRC